MRLADALARLHAPVFAVVDGALRPDLAVRLARAGLHGRALYLEGGDPAAVRAGPHLVALAGAGALDRLAAALRGGTGCVYWGWGGDPAALYRHLRTLALAEIPRERPEAGLPPYETVLFRHYDPRVLGPLLALMSPAQRGRLLGRATGVAADAPGGVVLERRPDLGPEPARAYLRFSPEQIAALAARRGEASRRKIAAYLRQVLPGWAGAMSEADLLAFVVRQEGLAGVYGVSGERALGRWAHMALRMSVDLGQIPEIHSFLTDPLIDAEADERMDELFELFRRELDEGAS